MTARILRIFAFASLAALLGAQSQNSINGPVAGYLFDQAAQTLRPILGVPGAALLGDPIRLGLKLAAAYVSPGTDSAIAIALDNSPHFFTISGGVFQEVPVNGLASGSSYLVAFSPSGKALALYSGNSVQVITGLPSAPAVGGSVNLASLGVPGSLALSDDGTVLLVSVANSVHLFGSYADLGKLMDTGASPAIGFGPGGHDAAVSDTNAGVVLFHNLTGSGTSQIIAPPGQNIAPSSALAFSANANTIYVASSSTQTITSLDLTSGFIERLPCGCSPTALARMGNVFRLTELTKDPVWLLDSPEGDARIVFVPALNQPGRSRVVNSRDTF